MRFSFYILSVFIIVCRTVVTKSEIQIGELSSGINNFGLDLFQQCSESKPGNIILSPFSMATALTLLSQATNGTTYEEMRKVLYLNSDKAVVADQYHEHFELVQKSAGPSSELMIANRIYVQQGYDLKKSFQYVAANKFSAKVESIDFCRNDAAQLINDFVSEKTKGKITKIVTPELLDDSTHVFLVNSIYLKSIWRQPFPRDATHRGPFYISDTKTVDVDFMLITKKVWHTTVEELDSAALGLDYANSSLSFIIILPNNRTGLATLETNLKKVNLSKIIDDMRFQECVVKIPKFKVESEFQMENILRNMGMRTIFSPSANLRDLLKSEGPLYVNHVIHKATIEITEKLTEASAASGLSVQMLMAVRRPDPFQADHPFLYFVWDRETKTTIFSGCIKTFSETIPEPYCDYRCRKWRDSLASSTEKIN